MNTNNPHFTEKYQYCTNYLQVMYLPKKKNGLFKNTWHSFGGITYDVMSQALYPEMHVTRYLFNFHKCQFRVRVRVRVSLSVYSLFVTLGLAFVFGLSLRFGLVLLCLSSRGEETRDTL